ncbi:organic cation transporter protein-like [Penaeus japonicus]|uniref:organic cation transporter protein-like n=1 Tax=Penaeus japonicus TaxID=27405 RepID=UPI001C70C99E|nr:organic cation transporter protein-like [Penaeus japonicus]
MEGKEDEDLRKPKEIERRNSEDLIKVQQTHQINTFEDLLELVGTRGRWNLRIFLICCAHMFACPFASVSYQFLGATPEHWCHVAPLVQANWTQDQIRALAIPYSNETGQYERCQMYDANYTLAAELGVEQSQNSSKLLSRLDTLPCETWDFDLSEYKSSVVTEWNLVCGRRPLYSSLQAVTQAGYLLGSFMMGYLCDKLGRRTVGVWSTVSILVVGVAMTTIPVFWVFLLLRLLFCIFIMGIYVPTFIISLEVSSPEFRSMASIVFILPWTIGYMVLPGIAYVVRSWQWLQAVLVAPYVPLLAYCWLLPESPRWLIQQGRFKEALDLFSQAAKVNKRTLPPKAEVLEAMEIIQQKLSEEAMTVGESDDNFLIRILKNIVVLIAKPELRVRTLAVFFCWFGVSMVYYGTALGATNLGVDIYTYMFLSGLLEVPAYLLLWPSIERLGRQKTLVMLFLICTASISSVAVIMFCFPNAPSGLKIFFSQVGKLCVTAGFHLTWVYTAEMFPTRYRSLAVGEGSCVARMGSICSPYIIDILGEVTAWAPSALFALISLLASILALLLPETRNRDMMETKGETPVKREDGSSLSSEA